MPDKSNQSTVKEELIVRLMTGQYGLTMGTAEVVADLMLQRERSILDEIEKPLKECSQELDSDYIVPQDKQNEIMQAALIEVYSTIARMRGERG